ncbi:MAG: transposase [Chitinophagales bacterium]|nr:transposase [Chitinophagales bacterium]
MYFFTATAKDWKNLFEDDEIKIILLQSMEWLVTNKKVQIHAFVIMPNHVHILWTHLDETYDIGASFKSFTASMIRKYLVKHNKLKLNLYISTQNDREYQFWKRRSKTIEMQNRIIAAQKVDYIHKNPLQEKWKLAALPEDYQYSSASFYLQDKSRFGFLTRYEDWI